MSKKAMYKDYTLSAAKVISRDVQGRPRMIQILTKEEKVPIQEGDEFIHLFVPSKVLIPRTN